MRNSKHVFLIVFNFYFYIYPAGFQENVGCIMPKSNYRANIPTCFRRCQDITVQSKFLFFFSFYLEM